MVLPNSAVSASRFILQRLEIHEFPMITAISSHVKNMTRHAHNEKSKMLALNSRHIWDVTAGPWNRMLTRGNVLHPEIEHLKIREFQEALPKLLKWIESESWLHPRGSMLILDSWWTYSRQMKPLEGEANPFFQKIPFEKKNGHNQNFSSKVVIQNFFYLSPLSI